METVGQLDAGYSDLLETFQSASAELTRFNTVIDVAEASLGLALTLTKSTVAFIALVDESGVQKQVFSRAADPMDALPQDEIERIFAAAASFSGPMTNATWRGHATATGPAIRSYSGQPLYAGGKALGMIGVASASGYTALQLRAFAIFANQVAAAIGVAQLNERRQEMIDTLVNLRSELDRSERQRLITEERAKSAERVERAHEAAVDALLAVSRHAKSGHGLADFYRRLTSSIAQLVAARKVLVWKLNEEGMLAAIPGAYG
ncbi:MAG TPA: GAF domain-containing protein, partial [Candidatus Dormibacteraeota bacterium]